VHGKIREMKNARSPRSAADLLGAEPARRGRRPGEGGRAPTPTRDRLNEAQAVLAETRAAKLRGELVPAADVESAWAAILLEVRAGMLAVADRVGARLGDLTPAHLAIIDSEIREALTALGEGRGRGV
jgi:phage terminase Nu1 subunit (DNA packaging protein)